MKKTGTKSKILSVNWGKHYSIKQSENIVQMQLLQPIQGLQPILAQLPYPEYLKSIIKII